MASLNGKVAIVTGSSRGIGRAVAERLSRDGANIVVTYAGNRDKALEVVSVIEANGTEAIALQVDLFKLGDIRNCCQDAIALGLYSWNLWTVYLSLLSAFDV